jgi:energy-coupling factor transport system permease/ATP-binding protein
MTGIKANTGDDVYDGPDVLVRLRDVTVSFLSGEPVLKNINLSIRHGESVLIIGPSGCGKSTLGMLLSGLIPRSVEGIVTGETEWAEQVLRSGGVGFVFQDPEAQFCMLEIQDEIAFGLENLQISRDKMGNIIEASLAQFGLNVDLNAFTTHLSGGMKQKLALACAFAMNPSFYLLDEPTANLDPASTDLVFQQVEELIRSNQTVVIIEHKFSGLLPFVERVVLLDSDGRLYRTGPTKEVMRDERKWLIDQGIILPPTKRHPRTATIQSSDKKSESSPLLSLKNGTLRYGKSIIWERINLEFHTGEWVAILGKNGAGKSSLLSALIGLNQLADGTVSLHGRALSKWSRKEIAKHMAFIFQNPEHQFIYQRVVDEIHNRVVTDQATDSRAIELLEEFGLTELAEYSPFSLSQGQKRRLSVACMLRDNHHIYMLDEPTFGQDARTQQAILDKLHGLHLRQATLLMTTHDMEIVKSYATRVVVLGHNQILFDGTPDQLWLDENLLKVANLFTETTDIEEKEVPV